MFAVLVTPFSQAQASNLTDAQVQAILSILSSFGADSATIASVNIALTGGTQSFPTPTAFCHNFNTDLTVGNSGSEVAALRQALSLNGIAPTTFNNTSPFDENTADYVVQFQARNGIRQTGYVGTATRARLNALYRCQTSQTTSTSNGNTGGDGAGTSAPQPSITITGYSGGQSSNATLTVNQGGQFTILGNPTNLGGLDYYSDYTRAFVFDSIFNGSCSNNTASEERWAATCTANTAGTGGYHVEIYRNGQTYRSNRITITVTPSLIGLTSVSGSASSNSSVVLTYRNLPSDSYIQLINQTTGNVQYTLSSVSGSGSGAISAVPAGTYFLRAKRSVSGSVDPVITESSAFIVGTSTSAPTITVISPNGGETWNRGQTYLVTWSRNNIPANDGPVLIRLRASIGGEYNLTTTNNDGAHSVTIPTTVPVGAYKLEIKYTGTIDYMDASDSYFKVTDTTTNTATAVSAPTITLNNSSNNSTLNLSAAFGGTVTFNWSVSPTNGTVCYAAGTGLGGTAGYETTALSGNWTTPPLYTNVTYGMKCVNSAGTTYKYAKVAVDVQTNTTTSDATLSASITSSSSATEGQSKTISGTATNLNSVFITITYSGGASQSVTIPVSNGSWSAVFSSGFSAGYHGVAVRASSGGSALDTDTLNVSAATTATVVGCSADGALFKSGTTREKGGVRSQCVSSGYTWQSPSYLGSGAYPSGYCAYGSYNYSNDTLGSVGSQCYNCSVGSWVPIASSYCGA